MSTMDCRIVHIAIRRNWRDVYAFASEPRNMPRWASGLAAGLEQNGEDWIADGGPLGQVRVRFAPDNDQGTIDHTVTLPDGTQVLNVLRVVPNGDGAEVIFAVFRQPGTSDAQFAADADHVAKDLKALKQLLEA